jgi:PAS domain S-box-containing protein
MIEKETDGGVRRINSVGLHQIKTSLEESKETFQHLFTVSADAILLVDAHSGIILDANPAVYPILGYNKKDIIEKHFSILFPPVLASPEKIADHHLNTIEFLGSTFTQEFYRPNGTVCLMDLSAAMSRHEDTAVIIAVFQQKPDWLNRKELSS